MRCACALTTGTSPGNDQRLTMAKLEGSRNFAEQALERGALRARQRA